MRKAIKIGIGIVGLLIIIPLVYLAYDRSLMPPKPDWPVPAFTPDPKYNPNINWLRGQGNNYFMNWVELHKENNALVHYINALSSMTITEDAEGVIETIVDEGWNKPNPEAEKALRLNKKTLDEVRLGALIKNCVLPPSPYSYSGPLLNFITSRKLARLIVAAGNKLEYEKKYSQALPYYLDGIQFGKDIASKKQNLLNHMIGIAVIKMQLKPISELIKQDKLPKKDLQQVITECSRIEKEQATFASAIEIEYRTIYTVLSDTTKNGNWILSKYLFNKGHVANRFINEMQEIMSILTTKSYREFILIDWDKISYTTWPQSYTYQMAEICLLRLAQIDAAIRMYHLEKKQWPKSVDDLKPNYLTEVPLDPFINQPFHLSQDSTGMFAYSVGPDFKDDSAKLIYGEGTTNRDLGDIR
jgi:hypothetical protein